MNLLTRPDVFRRNHKALRKALFDTAVQAGRTEFTQPGEIACLMTQFGEMTYFSHVHAYMEDTFCLPVLEAKCPGASIRHMQSHQEIDQMLHALEVQLSDVVNGAEDERNQLGYTFYLSLNRFVALCLSHLDDEETEMATLAYAVCSDEELQQINQQIMDSTTPIEADILYRYMVQALNETEQASLLNEVSGTAPASVREKLRVIAQAGGPYKTTYNQPEPMKNIIPFYMPVN